MSVSIKGAFGLVGQIKGRDVPLPLPDGTWDVRDMSLWYQGGLYPGVFVDYDSFRLYNNGQIAVGVGGIGLSNSSVCVMTLNVPYDIREGYSSANIINVTQWVENYSYRTAAIDFSEDGSKMLLASRAESSGSSSSWLGVFNCSTPFAASGSINLSTSTVVGLPLRGATWYNYGNNIIFATSNGAGVKKYNLDVPYTVTPGSEIYSTYSGPAISADASNDGSIITAVYSNGSSVVVWDTGVTETPISDTDLNIRSFYYDNTGRYGVQYSQYGSIKVYKLNSMF